PGGIQLARSAICHSSRDGFRSNCRRKTQTASAFLGRRNAGAGVRLTGGRSAAAPSREKSFSEGGCARRRSSGPGRGPIACEKIPPQRVQASCKIERAPDEAIIVGSL